MPFLSSRQRIVSLFVIAMGALLLVTLANVIHFYRFQDAMNKVIQTQTVLEDAAQLLSALKSVETSQRGYLLTGDTTYLSPFDENRADVWKWYGALDKVTLDNPIHQQTLHSVQPLLAQKLEEMGTTVNLRKAGNRTAAMSVVHTNVGHTWMVEIIRQIEHLEDYERDLFAGRNDQLQKETRHRLWFTLLGSLISVLLLGWMYYLLVRESAERLQALKTLEHNEKQLQRHAAELAASNTELEAFCYSVSHDLRAPLRGIEGFSRIVLDKYKNVLDAEGASYLERVRGGVQRMGQLIDELLRLSRITRAELRHEPVNLADLARSVVEELTRSQPERTVEWVIPPAISVVGDANLLKIALENLLGNAWKFTSPQARPRIEVGEQPSPQGPVYVVRDNGAGFDMAYKDKLFMAFQRLHSPAEFPGIGIGLATVQRVIHRHGGRIWAEGEVGRGATFYFTLA